MLYDVIIIGRGPAGLSAAIYTVRAGLKTLVLGMTEVGTLTKPYHIENYFGFEEPILSIDLLKNGEAQAKRLGAEIIDAQVTGVDMYANLIVKTTGQNYEGKAVLLATGQGRKNAGIPGEELFEGKGISYCAVCDGFFYKDRPVVVVGNGEYALAEAEELKNMASKVSILTNGKPLLFEAEGIDVYTEKIQKIESESSTMGNVSITGVTLENGSFIEANGMFVAVGTASATDFARKLGIEFEGTDIKVARNCETNFPGIFAAGDCIGGFKQIATAVGEGANASRGIIEYCRKNPGGSN